jgi:hypothetical protein
MEIDLRALACAVILRALDDARCDPSRVKDPSERIRRAMWRDHARAFLSGGDLLRVWCDVAGLDPATVTVLRDQQPGGWRRYRRYQRRPTAA